MDLKGLTLRVSYGGEIPEDTFEANAPFWLRLKEDHEISPFCELLARGRCKWLKASNYDKFLEVCEDFFQEYIQEGKHQVHLKVVVQPYTSLVDAYKLHNLILKPEVLPPTFSESLDLLKLKESVAAADEDFDQKLWSVFEYEDVDDEIKAELGEKEGHVPLHDLGASVQFHVINYSLLLAKVKKYCLFRFISETLGDLLARLKISQKFIKYPPVFGPELEKVEEAKVQLIFSMYRKNMDPHFVIAELYPKRHDEVYGIRCARCKLDPHEEDDVYYSLMAGLDPHEEDDDMYDPNGLLHDYLQRNMGYDENAEHPSVEEAQRKLMFEQGQLELYKIHNELVEDFKLAECPFIKKIESLMDQIHSVTDVATVIGVPSLSNKVEEVDDVEEMD